MSSDFTLRVRLDNNPFILFEDEDVELSQYQGARLDLFAEVTSLSGQFLGIFPLDTLLQVGRMGTKSRATRECDKSKRVVMLLYYVLDSTVYIHGHNC
eukprot:m.216192 g.216192  ORF g.216192 m.216192 type:complete len:98 (-) comp15105_c1_seq90:5002-5295(-)